MQAEEYLFFCFRTHLQDLKEVTAQVHYELYRNNRLEKVKGVPLDSVCSAPSITSSISNDGDEEKKKTSKPRRNQVQAAPAKNTPKANDVLNNNAQPIAVGDGKNWAQVCFQQGFFSSLYCAIFWEVEKQKIFSAHDREKLNLDSVANALFYDVFILLCFCCTSILSIDFTARMLTF